MLYQNPSFSLPVVGKKIDQTAYEIAVGLRCPVCYKLLTGRKHKCQADA